MQNRIERPSRIYAPALWIASAFSLGVVLCAETEFHHSFLFLLFFAVILAILSYFSSSKIRDVAILACFLALGAARIELARIKPFNLWSNHDDIKVVRGIISDFPYFSNGRWKATLKVLSIDCGEGFQKASGQIKLTFEKPEEPLAYGQLWELNQSPQSISGRDELYSRYLTRRGISGIIWAKDTDGILLDEDRGNFLFRKIISPFRELITTAIEQNLGEESGALLEGMLLGGGRKLSLETKAFFSHSGVIHILAVSGLHVGVIVLVLLWIFRRLLKRTLVFSAFAVIILLIFYSMLVQLRPSVVRATVMASFILLAPLLHRKANPINSLGAAALFLLLFRPFDIYNAGFQLSFAATGGILYLLPRLTVPFSRDFWIRKDWKVRTIQGIMVSIGAQLGTAPIAAFHFHKFQLIAPLANILVIPVLIPVISLGFLGIIVWTVVKPLGMLLLKLDSIMLSYILFVVKNLGKLKFAFAPVVDFPLWVWGAYLLFIVGLANFYWKRFWQICAIAGVSAVILFFIFFEHKDEIVFFDVDGTAVYASKKNESLLYYDASIESLDWTILPYLYSTGRKSIDILCLPLSRKNLNDGKHITERLDPETILTPRKLVDFPVDMTVVVDSINGNCISAKFLSDKNCEIYTIDTRILVLEAPLRGVEIDDVDFLSINYPGMFDEVSTLISNPDIIIIGCDGYGWEKTPNKILYTIGDFSTLQFDLE